MRSALILNFTGNTYHYGCFGTSYEIYEQLLEKGYYVNYATVRATHGLPLTPVSGETFMDPQFANKYMASNSPLTFAMEEADIIVVNGEGTLHRISKGSLSLLYQIFFATRVLKKDTYLINHSCYPTGTLEQNPGLEHFYKEVIQSLKGIVAREPHSKSFYDRVGLNSFQGFDSLPLYFKRQGYLESAFSKPEEQSILLCGGIHYNEEKLVQISSRLKKLNLKIKFLHGGKAHLAREEEAIYQRFRDQGLTVEMIKAKSFKEWAKQIAEASLLISGRFHYTIAAFALSTPCISFPSNTPKVESVHEMLKHNGFLGWADPSFEEKFSALIDEGLKGGLILDSDEHASMMQCAESNYTLIPAAQ
jgi:polysaccharide pyruvyl transferase WcaK-like protein